MERLGVPSNRPSSVAIPFGYAVDLCDNDGFGAEIKTIKGPFYTDRTMATPMVFLN